MNAPHDISATESPSSARRSRDTPRSDPATSGATESASASASVVF
jgi:hypothetical protein